MTLLFFILFFLTGTVNAAPLIEDPTFLQLGTADGLAQDKVQDIVRDRDGFIWVATEGGVSRWDGYRFVTLEGPDGLFVNNEIRNLFVDSSNRLWVSTYSDGVYFFDLNSNRYQLVSRVSYFDEEGWTQGADAFEELADGSMVVALEQHIIRYYPQTGESTELYRLTKEHIAEGDVIRDVKSIGDQLFIATSYGLEVMSLSKGLASLKTLNYLPAGDISNLSVNTKTLYTPSPDTLFIGTVGGLFSIPVTDLTKKDGDVIEVQGSRVVKDRNIWTMTPAGNGEYWLGTDLGLFRLYRENDQWQNSHILYPHAGIIALADKSIRSLLSDEQGNLWMGSVYGGLLFWYAKPLGIETYQNTIRDDEPVVADNTVWSFLQEDDILWVGTKNGLTAFNLKTEESRHFLRENDIANSSDVSIIMNIYPAPGDNLILETYRGLRMFSKQTGKISLLPAHTPEAEKVLNDWNFGTATDNEGRIYFISRGFWRYDPATEKLESLPLDIEGINANYSFTFLGADKRYPGKIFLSVRDAVLMVDTTDFGIRDVYRFPEKERNNISAVTSFMVDSHDVLWLGFPSYGMVGLDAETFAVKTYLNGTESLFTDIVYSLTGDESGNIWFTTHGFLGRYSPLSGSVERYRYGEDIRVSEFNDGAALKLSDGRLAFGSTAGFVLFDPEKLLDKAKQRARSVKKMVISNVLLDSRMIHEPMRNLSGEHVTFNHDDYGITIQFTALSSSYSRDTTFRYKLVRENSVVSESVSKNGSVTFAFLSPGEYHFDVSPLKQDNDVVLLPASLSFTIPYPPLRSPVAYSIYFCFLLVLLACYLFHRQRQQNRLHQAQHQVRLFGDAFQHTRDWVMIFDNAYMPVAVNPSCCAAFGLDSDKGLERQLNRMFENSPRLGKTLREKLSVLKAGEFWKSEESLTGADGRHYDVLVEVSVTGTMTDADKIDHYLIIMSDITEQKNAERKLIKVANYDSLTGLVNRTLLLERLEQAIERANHHGSEVGVLFVDLDRFKGINDSLGHDYGDKLLRIVANRMLNLASPDDTVARLGGDEFVIVTENVTDRQKVGEFVGHLIESVETPIALGNEVVRVSASVGISFYPEDASEPAELLKQSDVAMYTAKKDTVSGFSYFTEDMNAKVRDRLKLENRVKKAWQEQCFYNHYQPIINAKTGKTVGVELLLRCSLNDPPLYPSEFIPVLEELRYVIDVTRAAMQGAVEDLKTWYADGFEGYVAINLSALHFKTEFDIDGVKALLDEAGLPRSALRFELTEGILMDDAEGALRQVNRFIEAGFVLALDDFGTGYSSLSYLKKFPLQVLKIDKSFVDDIEPDGSNDALVLATIEMATNLNMRCVAEGVEEAGQVEYLLEKGCIYHQGYYYSRPVEAKYVPELLNRQWS